MAAFDSERVLDEAVEAFSETIATKLKQLRRFIPKEKAVTNPELTGAFIEELVRGFISTWIGHRQLLTGTLYCERDVGVKPLQLDGLVYDPTKGPTILREGQFGILHPAFCEGVIEIKMTFKNYVDSDKYPGLSKLEARLEDIHNRYLSHLPSTHVMAVVVSDDNPAAICVSDYKTSHGESVPYHSPTAVPLKPIFVLFKHSDGDFEPQTDAIRGLIQAVYRLRTSTQWA